MEYSILKKEKTWANIKVQNRASQKPLTENPLQEDTEGIPVKEKKKKLKLTIVAPKRAGKKDRKCFSEWFSKGVSSESVEREV